MKRKLVLLSLIIFFILFGIFASLFCIDQNMMRNNKPVIFSTWGKKYSPIEETPDTTKDDVEETATEPEYIDENMVKLGIYVQKGNNLVLTDTYSCDWSPENVMGLFYAIPSQEEVIPNSNFDTMWKEYINEYPNASNFKIGYNISFELEDGEKVNQNILNPDDAYLMFPKVMFFLYDDVNLVPGKPYYHITQDVMYDYTICSSAKLVGDVDTYKITSDIKLTAFCFDSEDDFDPETGAYRGNSSYTITIKNINK